MSWSAYLDIGEIEEKSIISPKGSYSVTSDILSFQRCPKQYGFFAVRNYQAAHSVQIWFGTIIHQVLNKLHFHYQGLLDPSTLEQLPSDNDISFYFEQVEDSLKASGVKAINLNVRETALKVLKIFNRLEGPTLYPNVKDTECDLQADEGDYIFHGVVDVLRDISIGRDLDNYDSVEIWDYKGSKFPNINEESGRRTLRGYTFQMLAYAKLYKMKTGKYPLKGKLYFLNELNVNPEPTRTPTQAIYEVDFRDPLNLDKMDAAIEVFSETVKEIEKCRETDTWEPAETPTKETCDICDLRWNCSKVNYPMRYP